MAQRFPNPLTLLTAPALILIAGCGGGVAASGFHFSESISIHANATHTDTAGHLQYSATLSGGEPTQVQWTATGGDPVSGPGSISPSGLYTPPTYLTQESAPVLITATPAQDPAQPGTATLTISPGFLQPLTPGNLALGPGASTQLSGSITEVGGSGALHFTLAADPSGSLPANPSELGALGALGQPTCRRSPVTNPTPAYTVCTVAYTAPASIPAPATAYILAAAPATGDDPPARSWSRVLLNPSGISSSPVAHQAHLPVPIPLGVSSGNNADYDQASGQLSDCCGGTLGALLQDASGTQFVLSNNHVLARSDQSFPGETIIQPGLIDNGCTPFAIGPGTTPVATLTGYPALALPQTNVDAAIARPTPGSIDTRGNILELGPRQSDGTLASAPPGTSSTAGRGESPTLGLSVAKSGRTTGLTCSQVSAINVDVVIDYFSDCAETHPALTKTFTNQFVVAGANFSDAGDSGALVVDASNAEPVGLFFAGATDSNGVEQAIANPASDVLAALSSQFPAPTGPTTYTFVGAQDHPVSCLTYAAPNPATPLLTPAARALAEAALPLAQLQLGAGTQRVTIAPSRDHPGLAALAFPLSTPNLPAGISGVPTQVPATDSPTQPRASSLALALTAKQRNAAALLRGNPAIFGVGVGQSLDNPADAAIILFVDRTRSPGNLPQSLDGQRVRLVLMDRPHVTRAHGQPAHAATCQPAPAAQPFSFRFPLMLPQ